MMKQHKIYDMSFEKIYQLYVNKILRKDKSIKDLDVIIFWLTGYDEMTIQPIFKDKYTMRKFFDEAPKMNPQRNLIKGVICGLRVEDIEHPLMQNIRYLDKLVDELARGKNMSSILRG